MNPILMEDLLGYRFLSGITVSPFENRAVFTVAVQDARSNGYKKNLWQVDPSPARPKSSPAMARPAPSSLKRRHSALSEARQKARHHRL